MNLDSHLPLVLDLCLKSSVILLVAFGVALIARKASAARRHLVWLSAFIVLAILPLTLAIPPRWSWSWEPQAPTRSVFLNTIPAAIHELPPTAETAPLKSAWKLPGWPAIAAGAWLAGALLLLARQAAGFWKLRALRLRSFVIASGPAAEIAMEFGAVEMRESPLCAVPLTWGWRRPVVLLPDSASLWPETQLRAALAHEFGHVARRDFLWRQIAQIVRAFFWPNPLVWLAVRALHRTQEQACDDLVLRLGASPREYAMQLLEAARSLAAPMFTSSQAVAMALPSTLEGRVRAIVDEHRDRRAPGHWSRVLAAAAIVAVIAGSAFAQVKSSPPEAPAAMQHVLIEAKFIEIPDDAIDPSDFPRVLSLERAGVLLETLMTKNGVNILSAPRLITRSGQRAMIEIADAPSPPAPGLKFEATPQISGNGPEIEVDFAATQTTVDQDRQIDGKPVAKTRVLKSNVKLTSGQTCISLSRAAGKGRSLLIAVTASIVDPKAVEQPKVTEPPKAQYAKPAPGKNGFVKSPFAPEADDVDVRGFPPGTEVLDPHSGKIFLVPETPIEIKAESTRTEDGISFAQGNVILIYGSAKITGDRLRYDPGKREVEVTGSARVEKDANVVTCEKILYWLDTGKMQTEGPSKTKISDKPAK